MAPPLKSINAAANCMELALAAANTNWHFLQITACAEGLQDRLLEMINVRDPAIQTKEFQELRSRVQSLREMAYKRQKML